jgi:hypothetical protein
MDALGFEYPDYERLDKGAEVGLETSRAELSSTRCGSVTE